MADFAIDLPYPPTANTYYRSNRGVVHISKRGRVYRRDVAILVIADNTTRHHKRPDPLTGRLSVTINVTFPDRKRRDLDNLLKAPLDALCKAGVYADDSQIDQLHVYRVGVEAPGRVDVAITRLGE